MTWREISARKIAEVIAANKGADDATLKAALFDAYPFGERKYHPYKIWCDEIARQLGRKPKLGTRRKRPGVPGANEDERQGGLFE